MKDPMDPKIFASHTKEKGLVFRIYKDYKDHSSVIKNKELGSSLVVQWLGLCTFTAVAQVQSLVAELRSCKPRGIVKKKKN